MLSSSLQVSSLLYLTPLSFLLFLFLFLLCRAVPTVYGSTQARGQIGATSVRSALRTSGPTGRVVTAFPKPLTACPTASASAQRWLSAHPCSSPCPGHLRTDSSSGTTTPSSSKPTTTSSAISYCPPWPSVSSAPLCSLVIQGLSPVLYARQLLGSPFTVCAGQDHRGGGSLPHHLASHLD